MHIQIAQWDKNNNLTSRVYCIHNYSRPLCCCSNNTGNAQRFPLYQQCFCSDPLHAHLCQCFSSLRNQSFEVQCFLPLAALLPWLRAMNVCWLFHREFPSWSLSFFFAQRLRPSYLCFYIRLKEELSYCECFPPKSLDMFSTCLNTLKNKKVKNWNRNSINLKKNHALLNNSCSCTTV